MGKTKKHKRTKAYLKFLSECESKKCACSVLRTAPPEVIKSICNAALNVQQNKKLHLSDKQRKFFRTHKRKINTLTSGSKSIEQQRKVLQSGGAFPLLGPLLSIALPALGSLLFAR